MALEREIGRVSPELVRQMAPGLSREETAARVAAVGLTAPPELLDFFDWHNGGLDPGHGPEAEIPIGPVYYLDRLDWFIEEYRKNLEFISDNLPQLEPIERPWFPFLWTRHGDLIVMNCDLPGDQGAVIAARSSAEGVAATAVPVQQCFASWTDAIRTGLWTRGERPHGLPGWDSHTGDDPSDSDLEMAGLGL